MKHPNSLTHWQVVKSPAAGKPIGEILSIDQVAQLLEANCEELSNRSAMAESFSDQGYAFQRIRAASSPPAEPPPGGWPQGSAPYREEGDEWKDADD